MTLSIDLSADAESRLKIVATRRGVGPEVVAKQILEENLPAAETQKHPDQATLDLFARWDAEDETSDPEEIVRRQAEVEEFKQAMNRNRLASEGPNARKIFP